MCLLCLLVAGFVRIHFVARLMIAWRASTEGHNNMRDRWAIILAGGDGTRLQPMTRALTGDNRPKQFVPVIGGSTLLDQTRRRVGRSVMPSQTFIVVTQKHRPFYESLVHEISPS